MFVLMADCVIVPYQDDKFAAISDAARSKSDQAIDLCFPALLRDLKYLRPWRMGRYAFPSADDVISANGVDEFVKFIGICAERFGCYDVDFGCFECVCDMLCTCIVVWKSV